MIDTTAPDAVSTRASLLDGTATAQSLIQAAIERIAKLEPSLHAWEVLAPDFALEQARAVDRALQDGARPGLLAGIPLAVKDIFDTAELPTGHGSPIYRGHRPKADAKAVASARGEGAIVMGKTVTTEFAYFTPGPTANPWNTARTPGGSSSGSAAAVASGMVALAFGSQTAGSLIRPASYCGVFALKPTHGRFSLSGVKPFAPSLDTLGWLARTADDLELMRAALASEAYVPLLEGQAHTLRLGLCRTHEWPSLDETGQKAWADGEARLRAAGVALATVTVPDDLAPLCDAQKAIMAREAAQSLGREATEHRDLLSQAILDLVQTGQSMSEARYHQAQALASAGRLALARLMQGIDALIVPAAPGEAPLGLAATGDPVFSRVWTLLGLPCVNVPGLLGPNGMPVGLQLVGRAGGERELLGVARAVHRLLT